MSLLSSTTLSMKFAMASRSTMTSFRLASVIRVRWHKAYSRRLPKRSHGRHDLARSRSDQTYSHQEHLMNTSRWIALAAFAGLAGVAGIGSRGATSAQDQAQERREQKQA